MAANACCGFPLRMEALLTLGTELEGHPDNVAASLLGGLALSSNVEGRIRSIPIGRPSRWSWRCCCRGCRYRPGSPARGSPRITPPPGGGVQRQPGGATGRGFRHRQAGRGPLRLRGPNASTLSSGANALSLRRHPGCGSGGRLGGVSQRVRAIGRALCAPERSARVVKAFREVQDKRQIPGKAFSVGIDNQGAILL